MRLSEFRIAMAEEFGEAYGSLLADDLSLTEMGGLTASQALAAGRAPRDIWIALCKASDVPEERWHGIGLLREP